MNPHLLHWQGDTLPLVPTGKRNVCMNIYTHTSLTVTTHQNLIVHAQKIKRKESSDTGRLLLHELTVGSLCVITCVLSRSVMSDSVITCSPPGSSVLAIFQARIQNRLLFPTPEDLPNPGIKPTPLESPAFNPRQVDSLSLCHLGSLLQNLHAGNSHRVIWIYETLQNKNIFIN